MSITMPAEQPITTKYLIEIDNKYYSQIIFTDIVHQEQHHSVVKAATELGLQFGRCGCVDGGVQITLRNYKDRRQHIMVPPSTLADHAHDCLLRDRRALAWDSNVFADYLEKGDRIEIYSIIKLIADQAAEKVASTSGAAIFVDNIKQPNGTVHAGLSGIFYSLINIAGWNQYIAGKVQDEKTFSIAMRQASSNVLVNGVRLDNNLCVPGSGFDDLCSPSISMFHKSLLNEEATDGRKHRGIVFGTIASIDVFGNAFNIKCHGIEHDLKISASKYYSLANSYGPALSKIGSPHCKVMAVMLVSAADNGELSVLDLEIVLTDSRYIPMDSFPEVGLADQFVLRGYRFIKPLKRGRNGQLVADFIVLFGDILIHIELWGMCTEEYIEYRNIKIVKYKDQCLVLVEFDQVNNQTYDSFFAKLEEKILELGGLGKALD